jgi:hypothetical protein
VFSGKRTETLFQHVYIFRLFGLGENEPRQKVFCMVFLLAELFRFEGSGAAVSFFGRFQFFGVFCFECLFLFREFLFQFYQ